MIRNVLGTITIEIALPIAVYFALVALGLPQVWALASSAGVSVISLAVRWLRSREVSTLSLLVLVQFALGVVVALVTGNARFVLAKDYLITFLVALAALASLKLERPFIARIRRDLSPDRTRFDIEWNGNARFRAVHRQLTWWWGIGLTLEVAVALAVIYSVPVGVAVVVTNILTPAVLLGLIAFTQRRAARAGTPNRDAPQDGAPEIARTGAGTGLAHQGEHAGAVPAENDYTETNRL